MRYPIHKKVEKKTEKSNLYLNGLEKQKRVEKSTLGKIKSLPKRLKRRRKVENPTPAHKKSLPK